MSFSGLNRDKTDLLKLSAERDLGWMELQVLRDTILTKSITISLCVAAFAFNNSAVLEGNSLKQSLYSRLNYLLLIMSLQCREPPSKHPRHPVPTWETV